jgi:hypothetical protein
MPCVPWSTGLGQASSAPERLRDAPVHGDVARLEPDEPVMDVRYQLLHRCHYSKVDPLVPASSPTPSTRDRLVHAAEHQHLH